ncbi:hypothetical protein O6P43_010527, partial [Quillaja saponaria]
ELFNICKLTENRACIDQLQTLSLMSVFSIGLEEVLVGKCSIQWRIAMNKCFCRLNLEIVGWMDEASDCGPCNSLFVRTLWSALLSFSLLIVYIHKSFFFFFFLCFEN